VSGITNVDRRTRRRQETRDEILDAAWSLVRSKGLAGLSLRELGTEVGMRAQSLYSYFASKDEIYDAMFAQGYREAIDATTPLSDELDRGADPFDLLFRGSRQFVSFCTSDPVRYQLLFQRTVPGFVPSEASYALAQDYLASLGRVFEACGIDDPRAGDLLTALLTGLTDQQISNDPGGDRWTRLVDDAVEMFLDYTRPGWQRKAKR
jgi:AcrR family transcriptional regulator